jgi:hypothetical protein
MSRAVALGLLLVAGVGGPTVGSSSGSYFRCLYATGPGAVRSG